MAVGHVPQIQEAQAEGWVRMLARALAGPATPESVSTSMRFAATPEQTWAGMMFYEEVPGKPPFPLRNFMPFPIRTDGAKAHAGDEVLCGYTSGDLIKRMTVIEAPNLVRFEVLEQRLGIEGCAVAQGGSYEIEAHAGGSEVVLTTRYLGYLKPRWLWRPLERQITHQLHRHVLRGMRNLVTGDPQTAVKPT